MNVIYEDNHLLVINKPCGLATMGVNPGADSVVNQAAAYIKSKYHKPGNAFIGVVSRLDAVVSGVLVLARTSKAASRLSDQIRRRSVTKRYLAIVQGIPRIGADGPMGGFVEVVHYLRKSETLQRIQVVDRSAREAQEAIMRLRTVCELDGCSIVEIDLVTGRKHQIRVQLSALGNPVLGDSKYGVRHGTGNNRFASVWPNGIGLHCHRVTVEHPTRSELLNFRAFPSHWEFGLKKLECGQSEFVSLFRNLEEKGSN